MAAVRVSALGFLVLTERLAIRVPAAIRLVPPGTRPEQVTDAVAELTRLGLFDAHGDVDERIAGRLRILHQASRVVDVVAHIEQPANAVLAATERRATLIVHDGHQVTVRKAAAQALGAQVTGLLPDTPAGYGRSVSVPTAALRNAAAESGDDVRTLESVLQRRNVGRDSAHLIAVMNQEATYTAQVGMTIERRRGARVIGWWRNESGGYLTEEHLSPSGESWTTIAPADAPRLAQQIDKALGVH